MRWLAQRAYTVRTESEGHEPEEGRRGPTDRPTQRGVVGVGSARRLEPELARPTTAAAASACVCAMCAHTASARVGWPGILNLMQSLGAMPLAGALKA